MGAGAYWSRKASLIFSDCAEVRACAGICAMSLTDSAVATTPASMGVSTAP
jgi:hypothetical protein